jgi:hypothetical protein
VSHGGYSPMRLTTGMGGISGISTALSSGDTSIRTCSTSSSVWSHLAKGTCGALEASDILPGAIFAGEVVPSDGLLAQRRQARHEWFARMKDSLMGTDLVFVDPDNGLEPAGYRPSSAKAGKSVLLSELHELARPQRCLVVYHHQSRRWGGHQCEIVYCAERLRASGFATVDALRATPYSPRVYFLLDASADVRRRAEQIESNWQGWITWHPGRRQCVLPSR